MSTIRFINITSLLHLGTITEKVGTRWIVRTQYGSEEPIVCTDILYRSGAVTGSYIFYELFHLNCEKWKGRFPGGSAHDRNYHTKVALSKISKRKDIKELRGQLNDLLATQY